jgi:hypothetical protein
LGRGESVVEGAGVVSGDLPFREAFLGGLGDFGACAGGVVGGTDVGDKWADVVGADVGNDDGVFAKCWLRGGRPSAAFVNGAVVRVGTVGADVGRVYGSAVKKRVVGGVGGVGGGAKRSCVVGCGAGEAGEATPAVEPIVRRLDGVTVGAE